eukprot:518814-Prymnesium_polylepis.1
MAASCAVGWRRQRNERQLLLLELAATDVDPLSPSCHATIEEMSSSSSLCSRKTHRWLSLHAAFPHHLHVEPSYK